MKKILELLVYRPNRWYDNLEEPFRFLVFTLGIILPISILLGCEMYLSYVIFLVVFISWRLIHFARPKKTYVFDIETQGLHNSNFDYAFMVKREKDKSTEKPEIIDTFTMITKINEKK